jgi:hypothetical protein
MKYRIVVQGKGKVYECELLTEARRQFALLVKLSNPPRCRSRKAVTLFRNYEIVREYQPVIGRPNTS